MRRQLFDIERRAFRTMLFVAPFVCAMLAAIGYVLPSHRVWGDDAFHSNFTDGGPHALL